MATISPTPKLQFLDANGNPLSYGLLYTYVAGTTTPKTTYTTAAQATANTNPIVLDSRGEADVWLLAGEAYKFTLQNSSGVLQYTVDQITAAGTMSTQNASNVNITGGSISGISLSGTITGNVIGNVTGNVTGDLTGNVSGGSIVGTSYNGGQLAGMRNIIINGDMSISQRGVSWAGVGASSAEPYIDRWRYTNSTDAVVSISRSAFTYPSPFSSCMSVTVSTADTSIGASQNAFISQTMFNATETLVNNTFTVSFWVKSSVTGVYSIAIRAFDLVFGNYRTLIKNYSVSVADTWEYKTIVITNGVEFPDSFFELLFALSAGTNFNGGTADIWVNTNNISTSAQPNLFATIGNNFSITGVQVERGAVATPFEFLSPGINEYLCQRDYQTIGTLGTPDFRYTFYASGAVTYYLPIVWPTLMSSSPPTVTIAGTWANTNVTSLTAVDPTRIGCSLAIAATGAGTTTISNGSTDGRITVATGR